MAKTVNSCRSKAGRSARAYGVLSAIAGPDYTLNRHLCCYRPPDGDPFYHGPCPPAPDGTEEAVEHVYGSFLHIGNLTVNAVNPVATDAEGQSYYRVNLNRTQLLSEDGIGFRRSVVYLTEPGVYFASLIFYMPANALVSTTLNIANTGAIVPGTNIRVEKAQTCNTQSVSAQALIEVGEDVAEISVVSSDALSILTPGSEDVVISLILFKIA